MAGPGNALNISSVGLVYFNGSTSFSAVPSTSAGAVFVSGAANNPPSYSAIFSVTDGTFTGLLSGTNVGGNVTLSIRNADNSNAGSNAIFRVSVGGGSAGSPMHIYNVTGGGSWTHGINNGSGDNFELAASDGLLGTNTVFTASAGGQFNLPLQPCFSAYLSASTSNDVTGDGTVYTVICDTEEYDQGGNYNNSTGVFTAPVAGKYLFQFTADLANLGAGHNAGDAYLTVSGGGYQGFSGNVGAMRDANNNVSVAVRQIISLAASATVSFQVLAQGGTKTVGVAGGVDASSRRITYVSGALIC